MRMKSINLIKFFSYTLQVLIDQEERIEVYLHCFRALNYTKSILQEETLCSL